MFISYFLIQNNICGTLCSDIALRLFLTTLVVLCNTVLNSSVQRFSYDNARQVKDFDDKIFAYGNQSFPCYRSSENNAIIFTKLYSTPAFINCLLWPSLGVVIGGFGVVCQYLPQLLKLLNSEISSGVCDGKTGIKRRLSFASQPPQMLISTISNAVYD